MERLRVFGGMRGGSKDAKARRLAPRRVEGCRSKVALGTRGCAAPWRVEGADRIVRRDARGPERLRGFAAGGEPLLVVRLVDAPVDLGLRQEERQATLADRLLGDDAFPDVGALRDVVHHLEEGLLDDRAEGAGAGLPLEGDLR